MPEELVLAAEEIVDARPFTNPQHSTEDLARLRAMVAQLVELYDDPMVCDFRPGSRPICQSDPQGRHFRIYYVQPDLLFRRQNLTVVGFFGHRRQSADVRPLIRADKQFEMAFHQHPGLLSLSTVRLPDGDFANLVLFTDDEAKDRWNLSPLHYDTVSKISPPYYRNIRLNNGLLPDGVAEPEALRLTRVKYIDYLSSPPWRAVRLFT